MSRMIDITQEMNPEMLVYPGDPRYNERSVSSFKTGDMCEVSELTLGSHCGTHVDAPLHMIPKGETLDCFQLDAFYGPCRVLTCQVPIISEKMLQEFDIREGERILLRTDPNGEYIENGRFNPAVISMRAAQYLAEKRIKLLGIDSPTIENMELCDGSVHRTLLKEGIVILEGLLLKEADGECYTLSAFPLKIAGGNGAPCRAVLIEE